MNNLIEVVPIIDLHPAPYNARRMKPAMLQKLKDSIKKFKAYSPLFVNKRTGNVFHGNQRLQALTELNFTTANVIWFDLPLKVEMAFALALNKIEGEDNPQSLAVIFQELMQTPDLLSQTGFDLPEVFRIIESNTTFADEDYVEEAPSEKTITQPGDLVTLGVHKLICADTTLPETLERLLGKDKVALTNEDLPYGVELDTRNRPMSKGQRRRKKVWQKIENDDLTAKEHVVWLRKLITTLKPFLAPGAAMYLWNGFRNFGGMTQVLEEEGFHVSNIITWIKDSACPGYSDYKFATEFVIYAWFKNGKHHWYGPPNEKNCWQIDRQLSTDSQLHPTAKPIELARRILRNSSKRGDVVFDGVMGSGFNLLSCHQAGRIFRGGDVSPLYIDTSVKRYLRTFGLDSVSKEVRAKYFGRDKR